MNLYLLDFHCSYTAWFLLLLARLKDPKGRNSHKIFQGLLNEYRWVIQKAVTFSTFYSVSTWQSRQCYKITCTPLHLHNQVRRSILEQFTQFIWKSLLRVTSLYPRINIFPKHWCLYAPTETTVYWLLQDHLILFSLFSSSQLVATNSSFSADATTTGSTEFKTATWKLDSHDQISFFYLWNKSEMHLTSLRIWPSGTRSLGLRHLKIVFK